MAWVYQSSGGSGYIIAKKQQFAIAIKRNFIMLALNSIEPGWVWKNTKVEIPLKV